VEVRVNLSRDDQPKFGSRDIFVYLMYLLAIYHVFLSGLLVPRLVFFSDSFAVLSNSEPCTNSEASR
jgi:hypothetical protein